MNKHQERVLAAQAYQKFNTNKGIQQNGKAPVLVPFYHVFTAKITGTTVDFIVSGETKAVGQKTFDGSALPAGKDMVIAAIKSEYATAATDAGLIASSDYSADAPSALIAGDFKITQGDRGVLAELLLDAMINNNTTPNNNDKELVLPDMPVIQGDMEFEAQSKLPVALAGGVDHYCKITVRGYVPKSR